MQFGQVRLAFFQVLSKYFSSKDGSAPVEKNCTVQYTYEVKFRESLLA